MTWYCTRCREPVADIADHVRLLHPDVEIEWWPDGGLVWWDEEEL